MLRKKKEEDERLVHLDGTLQSISKYEEKPTSEFFVFVKSFFTKFLDLKYELTYEELASEIEKSGQPDDLKVLVRGMCDQFVEHRYHKDIQQDVPKELIDSFREVVKALRYNHIISKQSKEKKASGMAWLHKFYESVFKWLVILISGLIKVIVFPFLIAAKGISKITRGRADKLEEELAGIKLQVDEIHDLFESKQYDKVKTKYQYLLQTYNGMSAQQKERIYVVLRDLHNRLTASAPQENKLSELIEEAHFLFENHDYSKTKDKYLKIFEIYNALNPKKKENFYEKVLELHNKLTGS